MANTNQTTQNQQQDPKKNFSEFGSRFGTSTGHGPMINGAGNQGDVLEGAHDEKLSVTNIETDNFDTIHTMGSGLVTKANFCGMISESMKATFKDYVGTRLILQPTGQLVLQGFFGSADTNPNAEVQAFTRETRTPQTNSIMAAYGQWNPKRKIYFPTQDGIDLLTDCVYIMNKSDIDPKRGAIRAKCFNKYFVEDAPHQAAGWPNYNAYNYQGEIYALVTFDMAKVLKVIMGDTNSENHKVEYAVSIANGFMSNYAAANQDINFILVVNQLDKVKLEKLAREAGMFMLNNNMGPAMY